MQIALFWFIFIIVLSAAHAGWNGAPWVPTRAKDREHIVAYLKQQSFATFIDLGAGTGTMLFALAPLFPNARYIGYDISLLPLWIGKFSSWFSPKKNITMRYQNLYHGDISQADVIYIFLMPNVHTEVARRVLCKAPPKARILFEGWPPEGYTPLTILSHSDCLPVYCFEGHQFHTS